ncbi:MAG: hypothetical protein FD176_171 [Rhodospirillaceae bacterium]|nr:MAG: hypothetical protein FD176_171 [Rhodospirillaceae bacterium]TNC98689.1 MAG: hypothetical protein FD119_160 [Stygiobacter sp.]
MTVPNPLTLRALRLIGGEWRGIGRTVPVRINRIVAEPWNSDRLQRARQLLAEGRKPPPVHLVSWRLGNIRIYEPSDGIHRVSAAREAGRSHIAARLSGEHVCDPARCLIRGRNFYVLKPDGYACDWENGVDEALLAELRRLGVPG